uniref:Uncharacterized protein n=1 Tax=Anopheles quadriannulatus TaxID=34691 RepID=A0A182XQG5_ANOQN
MGILVCISASEVK